MFAITQQLKIYQCFRFMGKQICSGCRENAVYAYLAGWQGASLWEYRPKASHRRTNFRV